MYDKRITTLRNEMKSDEAFLICNGISRRYLTGFKSSAGTLLLLCDGAYFFIDSRYYEIAAKTVKHCNVILQKNLTEQISAVFAEKKIKTVYTEVGSISLAEFYALVKRYENVKISDEPKMENKLLEIRSIKDKCEIEFIKHSQYLTEKTFEHILNYIKIGKTERETALEMEFFMCRLGSEGVAFDFIVVSGKNSSLPHGVPTDKPFEKGDFITMDFGALYGGYCSDMTRTVALKEVSDEQRKVYDTVLSAQKAGIDVICEGITGSQADMAARSVIESASYGEFFGHSLGHSVGLEIHENPVCSPKSDSVLKSGNIMTVEPGIYIPDHFGVRIEDMVLVTENGCENLTKAEKNLIIL